jgi:hypothetical protein
MATSTRRQASGENEQRQGQQSGARREDERSGQQGQQGQQARGAQQQGGQQQGRSQQGAQGAQGSQRNEQGRFEGNQPSRSTGQAAGKGRRGTEEEE